jgi:hypothetical protein
MFQKLVPIFGIKIEKERKSKRPPLNFILKPVFSVVFVILLFFLFNPIKASAATYYVDNSVTDVNVASATPDYTTYNHNTFATTGGTDSVYKTIADLNATSFAAGDYIYFRQGQTWHEQWLMKTGGSTGNPITIGSFGSGGNPVIDGSDTILGFTNIGGNIWQKTGLSTLPFVLVFNGSNPIASSSSVLSLSSQGQWAWSGGTSIAVYSTTDPSGNVEIGQRASAVDNNGKSYLTFSGITFQGSNTIYSGSGAGFYLHGTSNGITINSCIIKNNAGVGILVNVTTDSTVVSSSTLSYNGANGFYSNHNDNTNMKILNSTITHSGWNIPLGPQGSCGGIQAHILSGEIGNNTISNNGVDNTTNCTMGHEHGIYLLSETNGAPIVHDNQLFNNTQGAGVKARGGAIIYHNNVYNNENGIEVGGNSPNSATYNVYQNLVSNSTSMGFYEDGGVGGTTNFYAYNNDLYYAGAVGNEAIQIEDNLSALNIQNNIISRGSGAGHLYWIKVAETGTVNINNNLYYDTSGDSTPFESVSTQMNLSSWEGLGYDTTQSNLTTNPQFVNPGTDFHLQYNSPAINAGVNVGLLADYFGNPFVGLPDIGAYEFMNPIAPTSLAQYKSDGTTAISSGGWTNQATVVFKFNMSSTNSADMLTPQVELQQNGTSFTNTANNIGTAVAYSGSPVLGTVTISGLTDGNTYHWQAQASNSASAGPWLTSGGNPDFKVDLSAPTSGSITYTDGYYTSASVSLTVSDGTDTGGSNINTSSRIVQRKSATLTNGTCGSYGSFGTITPTGSYPNYTDTTVNSSTCYQYQYQVSDNAGNQATYTSSNTVFVLSLPLSASSLAQYQSDGIRSIPLGTTLGIASGVILQFSMSSTNSSDTLTPQVEIQQNGIPFTNTPTNTGSALSFTGTPVTGTVTIPSMGGGNYHWQARVINSAGQSSWVAMGGNPDFSIEFPPAANNSSAPTGCSNQAPSSSPDLFQIDTTNTKATVYFAPSGYAI